MSSNCSSDNIARCANCGNGNEDGNSLKACMACKLVKYCGRDCQIAHRPHHKKACKKRAKLLLLSHGDEKTLKAFIERGKPFTKEEQYEFFLIAVDAASQRTEDPLRNWTPPTPFDCPICMIPIPVERRACG